MWISWFWHLRFPTQLVSGIYPFVIQAVDPRDSQSLLNAAIYCFPRKLLLRQFFIKHLAPYGLLASFLTFYPRVNSFLCIASRWLSSFYVLYRQSRVLSVSFPITLPHFLLSFLTTSHPDQMQREKVTDKYYHFVPCLVQLFLPGAMHWAAGTHCTAEHAWIARVVPTVVMPPAPV